MSILSKSVTVIRKDGLLVFGQRALHAILSKLTILLNRFMRPWIVYRIRHFSSHDTEEVLKFAWTSFLGLMRPGQIESEFKELLRLFQEEKPKVVLEIGTASGGTLFCFARLAFGDATVVSIDLPEGEFGGGYPEWKVPIYQAFKQGSQDIHLLRDDSHNPSTFAKLVTILNGRMIDFLFIDGDHSYDGVKKDFEMYSPLVRRGGMIAFHDIAPAGVPDKAGGVRKFWSELTKERGQYREIIQDIKQEAWGIGVIMW